MPAIFTAILNLGSKRLIVALGFMAFVTYNLGKTTPWEICAGAGVAVAAIISFSVKPEPDKKDEAPKP